MTTESRSIGQPLAHPSQDILSLTSRHLVVLHGGLRTLVAELHFRRREVPVLGRQSPNGMSDRVPRELPIFRINSRLLAQSFEQ